MKRYLATTVFLAALALAGCQTPQQPASPTPQTPPASPTTAPAATSEMSLKIEEPSATTQENPVASTQESSASLAITPEKPKMVVTAVQDYKPFLVKTVGLADDGFYPPKIDIQVGTKVVFQNIDENGEHWPASDPHPVHTNEPALDAKRALKYNEIFEYTFNEVGTFPIHDHRHPNFTAVVNVTE